MGLDHTGGLWARRECWAFEADTLLLAMGRTPNTYSLNLPPAGLAIRDDKGLQADAAMRSTFPDIFSADDVVGWPMLETTAAK